MSIEKDISEQKYLQIVISEFLYRKLEELELTQAQLAKALSIPAGRLSKYLNMKETPRLEFVLELVTRLEFDIHTLLQHKENILMKNQSDSTGSITNNDISISNSDNAVVGNNNVVNNGEMYVNTVIRPPKRAYVPSEKDLTAEQASKLKSLVDEIVELETKSRTRPKRHQAIWSALNRKMKVTYYREIPRDKYIIAEMYLMKWKGRLSNQKKYIKNENEEWRKSRYKAIYTRFKKELNMNEIDIKLYLEQKHGISSLKEMSDELLDKFYHQLFSRTARKP